MIGKHRSVTQNIPKKTIYPTKNIPQSTRLCPLMIGKHGSVTQNIPQKNKTKYPTKNIPQSTRLCPLMIGKHGSVTQNIPQKNKTKYPTKNIPQSTRLCPLMIGKHGSVTHGKKWRHTKSIMETIDLTKWYSQCATKRVRKWTHSLSPRGGLEVLELWSLEAFIIFFLITMRFSFNMLMQIIEFF